MARHAFPFGFQCEENNDRSSVAKKAENSRKAARTKAEGGSPSSGGGA
jgi:hypothetical protein